MKIAIIGGGAAGLMCGAALAQNGQSATIFDGNEKLGKKLYITGKGRCNLTNNCTPSEFLDNVVRGKKFLMSAINRFSSDDCIKFFEDSGLPLKTERGNRVFPQSDKSSDVIKTLERLNKKNDIILNCKVEKIKKTAGGFELETAKGKFEFDIVVIATGGKSYSATGSTGDGYKFANTFGHNLIETRPALVAIELKDAFCKDLQGLSLKNVMLKCDYFDGKPASKSLFGEMMFAGDGITGPIVLSLSSLVNRAQKISLAIDFKPALSLDQLDRRLVRDFDESKNKNLSTIIEGLLPKKIVGVFLQKIGLARDQKVNSVTKEQRKLIAENLKNFSLKFKKLYPLESGIVTSGGVDTNQLSPKTFESKLCQNLYFIGEVVDVDCLTGGFNLQSAFSSGYACAQAILSKI